MRGIRFPAAGLAIALLAACQGADTLSDGGGAGRCLADRGIGGTGRPASEMVADRIVADRIVADRGIGGTGVFGTITGFGSICVNGLEVQFAANAAVQMDGAPAAPADLRVGQVVAVHAHGTDADMWTDRIAVVHLVSGPIWSAGPHVLNVAGQIVMLDGAIVSAADLRPGAWVEVSGLHDIEGAIRATRVDGRAPGTVSVSGHVEEHGGVPFIGALRLDAAQGALSPGVPVVVRGPINGETLSVQSVRVRSDRAIAARDERLVREGFVDVRDGTVRLGDGLEAHAGAAFGPPPPADAPVVVELVHGQGEALLAATWHPAPRMGGAGHAASPPAMQRPLSGMSIPSIAAPAAETPESNHERDGRGRP